MHKVFEPGAVELADPRGDPNQTIEVQQRIKELLHSSNANRREGLKQEIKNRGALALPGLINATYVWMNELEGKQAQRIVADLMCDLAKGNPVAIGLLFREGVLGTPFVVPRAIARRALDHLDWKPDSQDTQALRDEIKISERLDDVQSIVDLYTLLLRSGTKHDFTSALGLCKTWAKRSLKQSGDLLALLTQRFPDSVQEILTGVFLAAKDAYRDQNIAETLLQPLRPIPADWLHKDTILDLSIQVLGKNTPPRHTTVEYLWCYAAQDLKKQDAKAWKNALDTIGDKIQQKNYNKVIETIYRYWFRAVADAGNLQYLSKQANSASETWGTLAAVQLFFNSRQRVVKQALKDLEVENPERYESAYQMFDTLSDRGKESRDIQSRDGPVLLKG